MPCLPIGFRCTTAAVAVSWTFSRRRRRRSVIAFAFGFALPVQQRTLFVLVSREEPGEIGGKRRGHNVLQHVPARDYNFVVIWLI